jgi:hypothetical protein
MKVKKYHHQKHSNKMDKSERGSHTYYTLYMTAHYSGLVQALQSKLGLLTQTFPLSDMIVIHSSHSFAEHIE